MQHTIDTNIFKNNNNDKKCNGYNDCSCIKRNMTALSYYNKVSSSNEPQKFIDFCNKYYSKQYLQDYIHFICIHQNDFNKLQIETNTICSSVNGCLSTTRHYRDRRRVNEDNNSEIPHLCIDIFDSLHFYIYHMEECGLRISINNIDDIKDIDNGNDNNNSNYKDKAVSIIKKVIESKKSKWGLFKRLDNTKNSKFNIMQVSYNNNNNENDEKEAETDEKTENKDKKIKKKEKKSVWKKIQTTVNKYFGKNDEKKEKTSTDDIIDHIGSIGIEKNIVSCLKEYLIREEYDTDSIKNDIDIFDDEKKCNLLEATRYSLNCIEQIKKHMKMMNIATAAFSTGFVFWYWKYYKNIDDKKIRQQQVGWRGEDNDFGGFGVRELFVKKKFGSLKEEILNSKFISIKQFNEKVVGKGDAYFITEKCKNIKCIERDDELHFGIKKGDGLKRDHLYSLILYCDFTDFCSHFSSSFRRLKWNEPTSLVRERNRKYYHVSKHLREVIQYYGIDGRGIQYREYDNPNGRESGPLFSGLSFVMHIPEFCIRLNGPTSTTRHKEIGIRFATRDGMLIQLNNKYYPAKKVVFFDVSWLSGFAEEEERIFIGGRYKMELETIIIIKSANNYKDFFAAFYKLDKILSGDEMWRTVDETVTKKDFNIVSWFLSYILGESRNENKFDSFIKNTFYFFTQKKTQIVLNLYLLSRVKNKDFIGLVMNKIETTGDFDDIENNKIPSSSTNLFRGWLFRIFGNLKELIIHTTSYPDIFSFNIFELLSILEEVELPKSFKTIIIKEDHGTGWLKSVFSKKVQIRFALKNLKINLKTGQGYGKNEDWMVISL